MSFEITYKADCLFNDFYYSTDENKDKPLYKEMNVLVGEIKDLLGEIENRKARMTEIANKMIKEKDSRTDELVSFSPGGEVEVDDEEIEIGDEWWDNTYEVDSPSDNKLEKLYEGYWFVNVVNQRNGRFSLKVAEGWDFHLENLEWKEDCLQYENEKIENDYEGSEWSDGYARLEIPLLNSLDDSTELEQ